MAPTLMISPETLAAQIGRPTAPRIVDICLAEDFAADPRLIPGVERMAHTDAATDAALGQGEACVITCQKGLKLSQGVAALIRERGGAAQALAGGMVGWAQAGLPLWQADLHPQLGARGQRWVLPDGLTPDIIRQAWIVARLIDAAPVWMFVSADQVDLVADRFDAADVGSADSLAAQSPRLQALGARAGQAGVEQALAGHCLDTPATPAHLDAGFAVLDGLWRMGSEAWA